MVYRLWPWTVAIWVEERRGCICAPVHECVCRASTLWVPFTTLAKSMLWGWTNNEMSLEFQLGECPTKASGLGSCDEQVILLLLLLKKFKVRICLFAIYMVLSILSCLHHLIVLMILLFFLPQSPRPQSFSEKMEQIILFLVKINIHCSCSLQFSRTQRDIAPAESPARIWCKTKPTLLDQQWSYRVQTSWEVWFIGELVFALAQWKEWDSKYSAPCIVLPSSHKASQNLTWHKYFPMRSIGYIYRFCLGWQPSCGLYNSLIQSCIIFFREYHCLVFFEVNYNWHCSTKNWSSCDVTIIREKGLLLLCSSFDVRAKKFEFDDLMIKSGLLALDILVILIH